MKVPTTGHKGFDKLAAESGLMRGSVISDVQKSGHIRPHTMVECNGNVHLPGHLRDFDLDGMQFPHREDFHLPWWPAWRQFRRSLLGFTRDRSAILYRFRSWRGSVERVHGWMLTDGDHKEQCRLVLNPRHKSWDVMRICAEVITGANGREPALPGAGEKLSGLEPMLSSLGRKQA